MYLLQTPTSTPTSWYAGGFAVHKDSPGTLPIYLTLSNANVAGSAFWPGQVRSRPPSPPPFFMPSFAWLLSTARNFQPEGTL